MKIRTVEKDDFKEIDELIREAFTKTDHGYGNESELVTKIRKVNGYNSYLEVIALSNNKIIGHGLLSPVKIINKKEEFRGLVLAPLAVLPSSQGQKVGGKILLELEERARELGYSYISILGHASYYPKFGYIPASQYKIKAPFEVSDENFMIKPLLENALKNVTGTIKYSDAFE
ncbi:N-acetyltransferase [Lactococcus lactis]|uniref:GNAT family N-acetyltransferase n=1 Tax=Lactococcus lactis TaxID=1358 RepID=UPI0024180719|nr:N-acetyltransferase [Lactococcus lactis]MDG4972949.1 N-acetyltransferase [Lactococcus lactis]